MSITVRNGAAACLLALAGSTTLASDYPYYDEEAGVLTVPSVEAESQPGRFQNVILEPHAGGTWRLAGADEGVLLNPEQVERVRTVSTRGTPVQYIIQLSGTFPDACPEIGQITQKRDGNTFDVHVYYAWNNWLRDPGSVACPQVLTPFEATIALDMYGLPAGSYTLRVNGHEIRTFTLERHNVVSSGAGSSQPSTHCSVEPYTGSGWASMACNYESDHTLE